MQELLQAITTGLTAFTATNIDDILILVVLFAQANPSANLQDHNQDNHQSNPQGEDEPQLVRLQQIIAGQYLGFGILILASLPGFLGGFIVSRLWLGWLGLVPILMGFSHWLQNSSAETNVQAITNLHPTTKNKKYISSKFIDTQVYQVAAVTIGNGGDNIGIYIPLFANSNLSQLLIILTVFFVMIAVWCWIAYVLTCHPVILKALARYGQAFVPPVLIILGVYIFIESETYKLLGIGI